MMAAYLLLWGHGRLRPCLRRQELPSPTASWHLYGENGGWLTGFAVQVAFTLMFVLSILCAMPFIDLMLGFIFGDSVTLLNSPDELLVFPQSHRDHHQSVCPRLSQ